MSPPCLYIMCAARDDRHGASLSTTNVSFFFVLQKEVVLLWSPPTHTKTAPLPHLLCTGIDTSILPGTTKYVQSGIGKVSGIITTNITFPDNVLYWANVPNAMGQKLETYIYGKDSLRPDDKVKMCT